MPITESCDENVEEVSEADVEELVDKPGVRHVAVGYFAIFGGMWFLTADPVVCVPMILA